MHLNLELIDTPTELEDLSKILKNEEIIALDTEFIRENTYIPKLALIQLATKKEAWLIDVATLQPQAMLPLLNILTDPKILKVVHSALGDQESLFHTYRLTASPTFDTFEAASLLGLGESVGLSHLVQQLMGVTIKKSHARTDWLRRPISEEMKRYALADVQYLVPIAEKMLSRLEKLGRKPWAMELSAYYQNPALYEDPSEEIVHRLAIGGKVTQRTYIILRELVSWREQRARTLNIPRRRIADDETLIHIANSRPETVEQLEKFRGINQGEIKKQGSHILAMIHECLHKPPTGSPKMPTIHKPSASQSRVIDLLGTYLRVLCEDLEISSRQLLTARDLRKIVVENLTSTEQWIRAGICSPRVCELIGEELLAMLQGRRALTLEDGKLKITKLT
jgi:ribonuclease D